VEHRRRQQHGARDPQPRAVQELAQQHRVRVHRGGAEVELQVAGHVRHDEAEQDHARDGHDDLPADRRGEERRDGGDHVCPTVGW
jgi:hypothetical protein